MSLRRHAHASLLVATSASLVSSLLAACPPPDTGPDDPKPLKVTARVADDAPEPALGDKPPVLLPEVPDGIGVQVIDVGLLGVQDGHTGDIAVDAQGFGSLTFLVWGQPDAVVILESALDPDGAAVVDDSEPSNLNPSRLAFARGFPGQVYSVNRVLPSAGSGAFVVPNTPAVLPIDGTWTFRVGHYTVDDNASPPQKTPVDRPVHVTILARGPDTGSGRVDVNVHLTGGSDITASTAPNEPLLQGALTLLRTTWGAAGIELGEVRYDDVDPRFQILTLEQGRCDGGEIPDLLAEGAGAPAGIDLFFIQRFVCQLDNGVDVGESIGGLSAGIPGPPWVHGAAHAGVVVSSGFALGDARPLGVVMAHELSHFLGLYHTKESAFAGGDAVEDEIPDSPGGDDADENLMYFAANEDTSLSEGQAQVLRTSPWVAP
jgi:hypothetical protein